MVCDIQVLILWLGRLVKAEKFIDLFLVFYIFKIDYRIKNIDLLKATTFLYFNILYLGSISDLVYRSSGNHRSLFKNINCLPNNKGKS